MGAAMGNVAQTNFHKGTHMSLPIHRLPRNVRDVDFTKLHNSQRLILGDFVGARHAMNAVKGAQARCDVLKQYVMDNLERAQQGYEIAILQKAVAPTGAVDADVEKRMYEVLTDVVVKHKESLNDAATAALEQSAGAIQKRLEAHAKEALRIAAEGRAPIVIKEGSKLRKVEGTLQPEFKRMCELASARIPIMLVGPAGCGKTFLAEKLAEALGLEYSDVSCSEGMSESIFNGRLLPIGKGGQFEHVASPFMQRYEKGGVMLMDEMDAADSNLLTYANKAIANGGYTADARYTNPVVKKHKNFVIVAAANTFGNGADAMYVGRNQLDAATLDRFKIGMITMDYSRDVEASIASEELCAWAWAIREKIRAARLKRIMSTRVIKDLATMTTMYSWGAEQWAAAYFTGWSEAERKLVQG
jgi:MoxR-like ATPase